MMNSQYFFPAHVQRIIDGDTFDLDIDLGFGIIYQKQRFRLYGINAAEIKQYKNITEEEVKLGKQAKIQLENMLPEGTQIIVETHKDSKGKYGRYLATIWIPSALVNSIKETIVIGESSFTNLNTWLVRQGFAVEATY